MKTFKEFTLIHPESQCEIMVDINTESGKLEGLYCYANDRPKIEKQDGESYYSLPAKVGKNPLFAHFANRKRVFGLLITSGFIISLDESEADYNSDVQIIERCLTLYGFSNSLIIY